MPATEKMNAHRETNVYTETNGYTEITYGYTDVVTICDQLSDGDTEKWLHGEVTFIKYNDYTF